MAGPAPAAMGGHRWSASPPRRPGHQALRHRSTLPQRRRGRASAPPSFDNRLRLLEHRREVVVQRQFVVRETKERLRQLRTTPAVFDGRDKPDAAAEPAAWILRQRFRERARERVFTNARQGRDSNRTVVCDGDRTAEQPLVRDGGKRKLIRRRRAVCRTRVTSGAA